LQGAFLYWAFAWNPSWKNAERSWPSRPGRSESYYASLVIHQSLVDCEDYLLGIAALKRTEPRIPLE